MKRVILFLLAAFLAIAAGNSVEARTYKLRQGGTTVEFQLPRTFKAYQTTTIPYKLEGASGNTGIEAVSFEDIDQVRIDDVYDLAFPGDLSVNAEYVGMLHPDATPTRPEKEQLVYVDTIPPGARRWLLFRLTNVGDTIWDTEGCAYLLAIDLLREKSGRWNFHNIPEDYTYPGESVDVWVAVDGHPGEDVQVRFQYDWVGPSRDRIPVWFATASFKMGEEGASLVEAKSGSVTMEVTEPADVQHGLEEHNPSKNLPFEPIRYEPMPEKIIYKNHREFQHAYARPSGDGEGELELTVAPWTKHVTLKLVTSEGIATRRVRVKPDTSHLKLEANPDNVWTREVNGKMTPLVAVKVMPFQSEWYLQPFLERRMKWLCEHYGSYGVGALAIMEIPISMDEQSVERFRPVIDALRETGMPAVWWGGYMFDHGLYEKLSGLPIAEGMDAGYWEAELIDPNFPKAFICMLDKFFTQYGDTGYRSRDGRVPFVMDVPIGLAGFANKERGRRFGRFLTALDKKIFRRWLEVQYITIEALNEKWGSSYGAFEEIVPEEYEEGTPFEHLDSPGMIDWDDYCSYMFTRQFGKIADLVHEKHPNVMFGYLGEEGTLWGIENTDFPSAEKTRIGMRCEAFQTQDLITQSNCDFVGQYASARYPEELSASCEFLKKHGIDPFYLLRPMHSEGDLPPLFPCLKALWDGGGPALVYGFDPGGIAHLTETQLREMAFFTSLLPE